MSKIHVCRGAATRARVDRNDKTGSRDDHIADTSGSHSERHPMSAPVLLLLARGGVAEAPSRSAEAVRDAIQAERPGLDVRLAHSGQCLPTVAQTMRRIRRSDRREVILVGLDLAEHPGDPHGASQVARELRASHPDVAIAGARSFGPDASMLRFVDARLRDALAAVRADELDGLVLSAATAGDTRAQAQLARCARQWGQHHKLPVVVSYADGSGPTVAGAIRTLRSQGRRHVAVGSWFLTATADWLRERDAAVAAGAVAVAEPIGAVDDVVRLVLSRYAFAAMELLSVEQDRPAPEVLTPSRTEAETTPARHLSIVSA